MKIPFIMKKNKTKDLKNGFTLIEVLIAFAIINFFALPIITSLTNSSNSARYARDTYKAALYASNLLIEIERQLFLGMLNDSEINGFEDIISDFGVNYETDLYGYSLRIDKQESGGATFITELRTSNTPFSDAGSAISGTITAQLTANYLAANELIIYDNGLWLEGGNFSAFDGEKCRIDIPADTYADTAVNIYLGDSISDVAVELRNKSAMSAAVQIYYENMLPASISVVAAGTKNPSLIGFTRQKENSIYIITAEVCDRKGNKLVYKAKPVFV